MALGFGRKKEVVDTSNNANIAAFDEKSDPAQYDLDPEKADDGKMRKMSRVGGPLAASTTEDDAAIGVAKQIELEQTDSIKYRTCSWQKTAALLFSEYICLAIMSFPYSYSVLGLVPGIILTVVIAAVVLYTSLIVWEFCLRHPEVRDVCDLGQMLYWNWTWVWYFTAVMFILNNTFIQALHVLTGAKYLNTMTNGALCTVGFSAIWAVISWICSLPRTFDTLSKLATLSAFFTFVSVLLAAIFAGIEAHPYGYNTGGPTGALVGEPIVLTIAPAGTKFIDGMNAFLNISYTFIGQITIPSFIAEMKEPKDFPKALWAVTICEIIVFAVCAAVTYVYTGTQYNTAPAFGSLEEGYKKIAFSFMIPTLIFLGVLYASVSARFVFFRIFEGTRHKGNHTVLGWSAWAGILAGLWILAFIIAEVIPFFSYLLSLMSSLFDCFFGFIFWGTAYMRMRQADYGPGWITKRGIRGISGFVLNVFIILIGFYMLTAGTYATVQSIIDAYKTGQNFSADDTSPPEGQQPLLYPFQIVAALNISPIDPQSSVAKDFRGKVMLDRMMPPTKARLLANLPFRPHPPKALHLSWIHDPSARVRNCDATTLSSASKGRQADRKCSTTFHPTSEPPRAPQCLFHHAAPPQPLAQSLLQRRYASKDSREEEALSKTALHDLHAANGGKMVPFGGFSMPVQYADLSISESHKWTREKASLFDVGHMVQHRLSGPGASALLEKITPFSAIALKPYHSTLSCLLHPVSGGIVDDTVITRLGPETFYLVTNAACREKDLAYISEQIATYKADYGNIDWQVFDGWGLIAIQGPLSPDVLQGALESLGIEDIYLPSLYFGQCKHVIVQLPSKDLDPAPILISRAGYTGEDGFEISIPPHLTAPFADFLMKNAGPEQLRLAGLGARDSLRLEAGMCLYGHDLNEDTTPVSAGLSWVVHTDRRTEGGFHGDEVILKELVPAKQGGKGAAKRRIGLTIEGAPAREGAVIVALDLANGESPEVGRVTSGCPSPTLGKNIAMGYVERGYQKAGTRLGVVVRGKRREAEVTKMPFVKSRYWKQAAGTSPG